MKTKTLFFISVIMLMIIISGCDSLEDNTITTNINYVSSCNLSENQLAKAKILTSDAQTDEFGGIIRWDKCGKNESENTYLINISKKQTNISQKITQSLEQVKEYVSSINISKEDFRDEVDIEKTIFNLVNEERASKGIHELIWSDKLYSLSKSHSKSMIEEGFFKHSGDNVGENIVQTPLHYSVQGCGIVYIDNQIANCMFKTWKSSTMGHYENMVSRMYSYTSVGVACNLFECKGTQNFW